MAGTVSFSLNSPDGRAARDGREPLAGAAIPPEPVDEATAGAAVPATPRLPFAPDPGSYTQLWTSQSATTTAEEMKDDMEAYLDGYTDERPDYTAIQTAILNSSEWMGFLTVLPGNQVALVHSLGVFSSGLGRPTPAHNRIFGLLGEKIGASLPPIVMAPSVGLVPWLKIQTRYEPTEDSLATLETSENLTILI
jgi:hypothetical protein